MPRPTRRACGSRSHHAQAYIELICTFYRLFGWGMRQISGYMEDYWATRGLAIAVPSTSQLSERFAAMQVPLRQRACQVLCDNVGSAKRLSTRRDNPSRRRLRERAKISCGVGAVCSGTTTVFATTRSASPRRQAACPAALFRLTAGWVSRTYADGGACDSEAHQAPHQQTRQAGSPSRSHVRD